MTRSVCWPRIIRPTRRRVCFKSVSPPVSAQNCLGLSSPVIVRVKGRSRLPSPPAKITLQRWESCVCTRPIGRPVYFELQVLPRSAVAFTDFLLGGEQIDVTVVKKLDN